MSDSIVKKSGKHHLKQVVSQRHNDGTGGNHAPPEEMQQGRCSIGSMLLLPKMHKLNLT